VFSLRNALIAVLVVIATGAGVLVAGAALTQVSVDYTMDENAPASTAIPVGDDCPVGVPCKAQSVLSITADVEQPADDSITTISPEAFLGAPGTSIPNGALVGNTHVVAKYSDNGECTDLVRPTIDKTADFLDGGIKGEVADIACSETSDPPPLERTDRWPTCLESDLRVKYLRDNGHPVLRRSVAVIVVDLPWPFTDIETPINLLSFYVGDGNGFGGLTMKGIYNVAVTGDPNAPSEHAMCTPMTNTGLLLGQSAAGLTLQACVAQGRHTMTTVLTHDAAPNVVVDNTVTDTVTCSIPVGGVAEYPDIAGPAGKSSSLPAGALAGAAAAGAALLVGGAWYARRRRLS
jgi:hypothetical protein